MRTELADLFRTLEALDAEERRRGLPSSERVRNLHRDAAQLLNGLLKACGSRDVIEIGTSNGYSTLWWAEAVERSSGRVTTLEIREDREEPARRNFAAAGVSDRVEMLLGDARETLTHLEGPFDFAFIDAEKDDYVDYLELLLPKLAPRALIAADNITSHPAETAPYLSLVRQHDGLATVTLTVGCGVELSVKLPPGGSVPADGNDLERLTHILVTAMSRGAAS